MSRELSVSAFCRFPVESRLVYGIMDVLAARRSGGFTLSGDWRVSRHWQRAPLLRRACYWDSDWTDIYPPPPPVVSPRPAHPSQTHSPINKKPTSRLHLKPLSGNRCASDITLWMRNYFRWLRVSHAPFVFILLLTISLHLYIYISRRMFWIWFTVNFTPLITIYINWKRNKHLSLYFSIRRLKTDTSFSLGVKNNWTYCTVEFVSQLYDPINNVLTRLSR